MCASECVCVSVSVCVYWCVSMYVNECVCMCVRLFFVSALLRPKRLHQRQTGLWLEQVRGTWEHATRATSNFVILQKW